LVEVSDRQRIDRWLWHARIVRTRDAAASLTGAGYVRLNGTRIVAPGRAVRIGDVLTVALDRTVRVLRVTGFVARRGPAGSGQALYEDLNPWQDMAEGTVAGQAVGRAPGEVPVPSCSDAQTLRANDPCDRSSAPKKFA
jgi:ribosome-associated heat shock protein Hsp15